MAGLPSLAAINGGAPGANPFTFRGLTFNSVDCPTELSIGTGEQKMVVTETIGGGKVVHVTGFQPDLNTWTGEFHQPNIDSNVATMRGWMIDGKEGLVEWKSERYYGIVRSFKPTYRRGGNVCTWILAVEITRAANGAFSVVAPLPAVDDAIATHFQYIDAANTTIQNVYGTAAGAAAVISDPAAAKQFDNAQTAAAGINSTLSTTTGAVALATPIASAAQTAVASASAAVTSAQTAIPSYATAFPTGSSSAIAAGQIVTSLSVIGALIGTKQSQTSQMLQGANLFAIAATKYGDPSRAYDILQANPKVVSPILPSALSIAVALPPLAGIFQDGSK